VRGMGQEQEERAALRIVEVLDKKNVKGGSCEEDNRLKRGVCINFGKPKEPIYLNRWDLWKSVRGLAAKMFLTKGGETIPIVGKEILKKRFHQYT